MALWRDEVSATPDVEVYRAVLPALMTTKGMLIGISTRYSAEGVTSAFSESGITYKAAEKSKSDLYLDLSPLFTRGAISIPDYAPLIRELRLLKRQTHRGRRHRGSPPTRQRRYRQCAVRL